MGLNKKMFDLDDIFEDIFEDWFRFGRKGKKVAKKGCKPLIGCLGLLFLGTLFISICGALTLFSTNRLSLPNRGTTIESGEGINTELVQDSTAADQIAETPLSFDAETEPEITEEAPVTEEIAESTAELREAIYIELVEDSRIIDQIGDPLPLIESDLLATVSRPFRSQEVELTFEGTVFGSTGSAAISGNASQAGNEVTLTELQLVTESDDVIDLLIETGR